MTRVKRYLKLTCSAMVAFLAIICVLGLALCSMLMYCVEYIFDEE